MIARETYADHNISTPCALQANACATLGTAAGRSPQPMTWAFRGAPMALLGYRPGSAARENRAGLGSEGLIAVRCGSCIETCDFAREAERRMAGLATDDWIVNR